MSKKKTTWEKDGYYDARVRELMEEGATLSRACEIAAQEVKHFQLDKPRGFFSWLRKKNDAST